MGFNCIYGELETSVNTVTCSCERLWFSLMIVFSLLNAEVLCWELSFLWNDILFLFIIGGSIQCFEWNVRELSTRFANEFEAIKINLLSWLNILFLDLLLIHPPTVLSVCYWIWGFGLLLQGFESANSRENGQKLCHILKLSEFSNFVKNEINSWT